MGGRTREAARASRDDAVGRMEADVSREAIVIPNTSAFRRMGEKVMRHVTRSSAALVLVAAGALGCGATSATQRILVRK